MTWTVPATVVRVIDADTIVVDLDLGWRVYRNREHIRVAGINAPERGTTEGRAATQWASKKLPAGLRVLVESQAKPSFERTVGTVALVDADGNLSDYAAEAVQAGMASWVS